MSDEHLPPDHDAVMRRILSGKRVAVVGISAKPDRTSYRIARQLQAAGYEVVPVNPAIDEWEGLPAYAAVSDIPGPVDWVDIFRHPEQVGPVVDDAVRKGVQGIWMQVGIVNEAAATQARAAGVDVIMDR